MHENRDYWKLNYALHWRQCHDKETFSYHINKRQPICKRMRWRNFSIHLNILLICSSSPFANQYWVAHTSQCFLSQIKNKIGSFTCFKKLGMAATSKSNVHWEDTSCRAKSKVCLECDHRYLHSRRSCCQEGKQQKILLPRATWAGLVYKSAKSWKTKIWSFALFYNFPISLP